MFAGPGIRMDEGSARGGGIFLQNFEGFGVGSDDVEDERLFEVLRKHELVLESLALEGVGLEGEFRPVIKAQFA